ncbi:FtsQ-type POTRA domain-containing protein [Salinicoccus siamensis]|uniref:Cell division protein DivIB n=1 Tax=Salinicoccus siamensis TaxID=381830 RepID=A0ABV5Z5Q6_9STAP
MDNHNDIDELKRKLKHRERERDSRDSEERLQQDPPPPVEASKKSADKNVEAIGNGKRKVASRSKASRKAALPDDEVETFHHGKTISFRMDEKSTKNDGSEKGKGVPKRKKVKLKMPVLTRAHLFLGVIITLLLAAGGLIYYAASSVSDVKEIALEGNEMISDQEVMERLQFEEGDKMFSANLSRAEENIAMLPAIDEVTIERQWLNTINVSISERQSVAYVASGDVFYPVLENAQVLRGHPAMPETAPILHFFEGQEFDALIDNLNKMERDVLEGISEIYYRPSENTDTRIHIFMNNGQEIVADYRTIDEKMDYYLSMQEEIGEPGGGIIDIEIGSSFLPYGSEEADDVKKGIYENPVKPRYIEDIEETLGDLKSQLTSIGEENE